MNETGFGRDKLVEKYSTYDFPYIVVTADINIRKLYDFAKANQVSFYTTMIYCVMKTANDIPNFHYRIGKDNKIELFEKLTASFTYLPDGWDQFYVVDIPFDGDIIEFSRFAKERAEEKGKCDEHEVMHSAGNPAIIYMSVMPWIRYTQFVRTIHHAGKDCVPRISWGKFNKTEDGMMMPVSVQVHHALMDGYHVGMFYEKLQELIDNL